MIPEGERVRRAADFLAKRLTARPEIAVILGSGLGEVTVDRPSARIPYERIPGFPRPSVAGHSGVLTLEGRAAILRGRVHAYEGRRLEEIVRPVRVMASLGARTLVVTNAAGAVNPAFRPGDLMLIADHLNLMGVNPLRGGPNFVDLSRAYDPDLRRLAARGARRLKFRLREGVYAAMAGPSYETPAEVRMLRRLGADAVGMSTVPEVIAAVHAGMRVLGVSIITNPGAGLSRRPLSHDEVLAETRRAGGKLEALLSEILAGM